MRSTTRTRCGYSFCLLFLLALYSSLIQFPHIGEILSTKHGNITQVIGKTLHKSKELLENRFNELQSWGKDFINDGGGGKGHVTRYEPIKCSVKSQPHRSIFYIRTRRSASTTLRNMLLIYGREYNLTICMDALDLRRANWPYRADVTRLTKTRHERCQVVAEEIVYSNELVDQIMAEKVFTLTSVRHPVQHFISLFREMKIQEVVQRVTNQKKLTEHQAMEIFLKDWESFQRAFATDENTGIGDKLHLGMIRSNLQSFSLDITDSISVNEVLVRLDEMSLIVVFERFDESMVILREKLCCSLDDVAYRQMPNRKSSPVYPTEELQKLIINFNRIDAIFYQHAVKRLDEEMSKFENFDQLLGIYRAELKKFEAKCTDANFPAQFKNKICPPVEEGQINKFVGDVRREQKLILLDKLKRRFGRFGVKHPK